MSNVHAEKASQAVSYLKQEEIDLWMILSTEGRDPSLALLAEERPSGLSAFILTRNGDRIAICSSIDSAGIEASGVFDQVIPFRLGIGQPLKETLLSLGPTQIALNFSRSDGLCDGLGLGRYHWLRELLGEDFRGEFISSEKVLKRLRSVKTAEEIRRISEAVAVTLLIYDTVFPRLRPGLREKDVAALFVEEMVRRNVVNGNDKTLSGPMVLKERMAHRKPGDAVISPGDFLVMDFSVDFMGYASDIARTAYFLKPGEREAPGKMQDAFDAAHGAITAALRRMRPGVQGFEVDNAARKFITDCGFPEIRHATGHQVGRKPHDGGVMLGPRWERYGEAPYGVLEEGMVFAVEPTVLQDDGPCVIVEENVLVTREGVHLLSTRQDALVLVSP